MRYHGPELMQWCRVPISPSACPGVSRRWAALLITRSNSTIGPLRIICKLLMILGKLIHSWKLGPMIVCSSVPASGVGEWRRAARHLRDVQRHISSCERDLRRWTHAPRSGDYTGTRCDRYIRACFAISRVRQGYGQVMASTLWQSYAWRQL
jgi:hypothetical protein